MRGLRFSVLLSAFAATAVQSAATYQDDVDVAALLARQAPGTPKFECHSDCGSALGGSRSGRHCDNSTWIELFKDCLECANEFNIWQHYGNGLTAAAEACGLSAVPSPSSGGEEPVESTTTPVGSFVTTEAPATASEDSASSSTADAAESTVTDAPQTTAPAPASTSEPVTGGASGFAYASVSLMSAGTLIAMFVGIIGW
ncbi:hypothetical protein QBC40DRAFT_282921 [Triangularia verruculosa]|uniref:Uncharacterized protein n=1 Tax=Triangularia verruculosa TaxID=2587418 RepID=A0AAN7ARW1_9PEZI|nr:hypothetical protein QBC40DRAFT_282921 [Triangularia verruculosa]